MVMQTYFVTTENNFIPGPYETYRAKQMINRLAMKRCKHLIGHSRGYYPKDHTDHLKFGHQLVKSTRVRSSGELRKLGFEIGP